MNRPPRALIYARYSSDLQSASSTEDQIRVCRQLCATQGWVVVDTVEDRAVSGASHLRPGFQRLHEAARDGVCDVIVAEALDRLSRDQEHMAGLYKRLAHHGVKIVTRSEGEIDEMRVSFGGLMSSQFLKQLAEKTRRGLEGRVMAGKSGGGNCYGYRVRRGFDAGGAVITGERDIDDAEAAVVRRIFADYDAGLSARSIAAALNGEGVTPPRSGGKGSGSWGSSTIQGNWKRGTGILNNELYIGVRVWNRQSFVKDPDTSKRQARLNPPEMWVTTEVPDLRIIDAALWDRVKARQAGIREAMNPAGVNVPRPRPERARRPDYLLSGLVRCEGCGSGYSMINRTRLGCSGARNRGAAVCTNRATIRREELEERVLGGLRDRLMHPELVAAFVEAYRLAFNEAAGRRSSDHDAGRRELAQIEGKITGILTAIEDNMYHPSMKAKMEALEARKTELIRMLAETPEPPALRLHPALGERYRQEIGHLAEALQRPSTRPTATGILRGLIREIRMVPEADAPGGHHVKLVGELAGILGLVEGAAGVGRPDMTKPPRVARAGGSSESVTVVAGIGFEPMTFRL
ncbi:recombinase family protein [Paracoccus hibiscisoli]|uniref:Recombinase family protein n=1 Tax=Paracoccus hibiscisoli TaxID=2023261 RepID=A0A4U0QJX6_9RHOB|nr:recombinase family protein [Paracoccus hibiscisoli]